MQEADTPFPRKRAIVPNFRVFRTVGGREQALDTMRVTRYIQDQEAGSSCGVPIACPPAAG
jgi:hypothetical protein